jgi:hypothetical protein
VIRASRRPQQTTICPDSEDRGPPGSGRSPADAERCGWSGGFRPFGGHAVRQRRGLQCAAAAARMGMPLPGRDLAQPEAVRLLVRAVSRRLAVHGAVQRVCVSLAWLAVRWSR